MSRIVPTLAIVTVAFVASCTSLLGSTDVPNPADAAGTESGGANGGSSSAQGDGSGSDTAADMSAGPGDATVGDGPTSSDGAPAGDAGDAANGPCGQGATQCSGNGVQTCGAGGQWGSTVPCPDSTPLCSQGACTAPLSCRGPVGDAGDAGDGLTSCGSTYESCCTSHLVTGGTFNRVYTNTGSEPSGEGAPATVSSFRLDSYDVTVGRFRRFVAAWAGGAGWTPPMGAGKHTHLNGGHGLLNVASDAGVEYETGWVTSNNGNISPTDSWLACDASYATWTPTPGNNERRPITCVDWDEAYAFCIWDGGFLPSDAEFAYAASGGMLERKYPWGSTDPGTMNQYAIYGCYYQGSGTCTAVVNIAPVGSAPLGAGYWGQLDLGGNIYQWNLDWFESLYRTPSIDAADLTMPTQGFTGRTVRGATFQGVTTDLDPTNAAYSPPGTRSYDTGFRCARVP